MGSNPFCVTQRNDFSRAARALADKYREAADVMQGDDALKVAVSLLDLAIEDAKFGEVMEKINQGGVVK